MGHEIDVGDRVLHVSPIVDEILSCAHIDEVLSRDPRRPFILVRVIGCGQPAYLLSKIGQKAVRGAFGSIAPRALDDVEDPRHDACDAEHTDRIASTRCADAPIQLLVVPAH